MVSGGLLLTFLRSGLFCPDCGITLGQPVLELLQIHLSDGTDPIPAILVIGQIGGAGIGIAGRAHDDLVFIEAARLGIHLVDNEYRAVGVFCVLGQEYIDVIAVLAGGALEVTVVVGHRGFPASAASIGTATNGATRVLDGDVQAVQGDVALLVVARLFLGIAGIGFGLLGSGIYLRSRNPRFGGGLCGDVGLLCSSGTE